MAQQVSVQTISEFWVTALCPQRTGHGRCVSYCLWVIAEKSWVWEYWCKRQVGEWWIYTLSTNKSFPRVNSILPKNSQMHKMQNTCTLIFHFNPYTIFSGGWGRLSSSPTDQAKVVVIHPISSDERWRQKWIPDSGGILELCAAFRLRNRAFVQV